MLIRGVTQPLAPETWLTPPSSSQAAHPPPPARSSEASGVTHSSETRGGDDFASAAARRNSQMDALRFGVVGNPGLSFVPYFLVQEEVFEVYPAFE